MVQITAIVVVMATLFTGGILSRLLSSTMREPSIPKHSLWLQLKGEKKHHNSSKFSNI
ncbi:unnamed protein product [Nezara viridula]|uniref:Uncharacterized protein n=1 Tax=Nezara viridula TaxID=85310 RepID=A0A9P0HS01_NEZVI|nr:unnamed protein product [Nezara viridula]